ncbi:MAG: hypothetical protein ABIK09_19355 [Pseudomonadota bacterium]
MRNLTLPVILALVLTACNTGTDGGLPGEDISVETGSTWEIVPDMGVEPDQLGLDQGTREETSDSSSDLAEDAAAPCEPGVGCFLDPCEENGDCLSGWCVQHMGEDVCTQPCTEECPPGWSCKQVGASDPDVVFICVSNLANLCRPCAAAGDCESLGGAEDVCVAYGPEAGAFCGGACEDDGDCPDGHSCGDVVTIDGFPTRQCINDLGECPCTGTSVALVLWTPCALENDLGLCTGTRVCAAGGLTTCDAAEPAPDLCNGADDDCDGLTDEETCDDGNPCTGDACLGAAGCEHVAKESGECADGNPCSAADHCVAGVCVGDPVLCDDQNPCTDDSCTEAGGCAHVPNALDCDDGDPCTVADECGGGACAGTPVACDCAQDEDCLPLEDGDLCNGTLLCDSGALPFQCVVDPGTVVACPAPEGTAAPCLVPTCDPETGACGFAPGNDGAPCDDGDPCALADTCSEGACVAGVTANCNDGNPCTDDGCLPGVGCTHTANTLPCDDGNACTVGDACQGGLCVVGDDLGCEDDNVCTDDSCDPLIGCVHTNNAAPCDDGNPCTAGDHCAGGWCVVSGELGCDDGNPCTDDTCDLADGGCKTTLNAAPCDDGDVCTLGDVCGLGDCLPGPSLSCDDGNVCTDDACDPADGCLHTENAAACDDGNTCTAGDHCVDGACTFETVTICDDGNLCTTDYCSPVTGCQTVTNTLPCNDGDACTTGDVCGGGACGGTGAVTCDDGNPCTDDGCDPTTGCEITNNTAGCDDGNACTTVDVCEDGECHGWIALDCDDGDICTTDTCDPVSGCVYVLNTQPCDDQDACTTVDVCSGGSCVGSSPLPCNDGNHCTADSCAPQSGCVFAPITPCCGNGITEAPAEGCDDGNQNSGDGCDGSCQPEDGTCFENWLVGTPCNGVNYGNGCVPSDTGYHFVGLFGSYACFWHHKNQAWNTSTSSNYYHLGLHFEVTPGVGKVSWCHDKASTPTPDSYSSSYFSAGDVGAWGWCAESDPNSVGFVCIPHEGHPACN